MQTRTAISALNNKKNSSFYVVDRLPDAVVRTGVTGSMARIALYLSCCVNDTACYHY